MIRSNTEIKKVSKKSKDAAVALDTDPQYKDAISKEVIDTFLFNEDIEGSEGDEIKVL